MKRAAQDRAARRERRPLRWQSVVGTNPVTSDKAGQETVWYQHRGFIQDVNEAYVGGKLVRETYTGYELALDEQELRKTARYQEAKAWFHGLRSDVDRDMLPIGDVWGKSAEAGTLLLASDADLPGIRAFLEKNGLSANAFFNAVFAFVLSRFTGKREALYNTVTTAGAIPGRAAV